MRGVIEDGQALDGAAIGHPIEYKIHRPDFVRPSGTYQWLPIGYRHLLASSPSNLQALFGIESFNPLVLHSPSSLAELEIDHRRAVAPIALSKAQDLSA